MEPLGVIRPRVNAILRSFLDGKRPMLRDDLAPLLSAAADLLAEGKRLRPAFCYWGFRAAGGNVPESGTDLIVPESGTDLIVPESGTGDHEDDRVFLAAASLELLQASALVHDDVMDDSDTRRGMPATHRRFETLHRERSYGGDAAAFGAGSAILLGDLLLVWSDELFTDAGLPSGRAVFDRTRTELMCGQYLDLLEQARGEATFESAHRVALHKSGRYSVERPLELGLTMGGASGDWVPELSGAYGGKIGVAFQMRDDILGVFGDPALTGKPAGDDLREGKRTMLVARTLELASIAQRETVRSGLGDPGMSDHALADLRTIIDETGALASCEEMIKRYVEDAAHALRQAPITGEAREALEDLAVAATARRH